MNIFKCFICKRTVHWIYAMEPFKPTNFLGHSNNQQFLRLSYTYRLPAMAICPEHPLKPWPAPPLPSQPPGVFSTAQFLPGAPADTTTVTYPYNPPSQRNQVRKCKGQIVSHLHRLKNLDSCIIIFFQPGFGSSLKWYFTDHASLVYCQWQEN